MNYYVYCIIDPIINEVIYVGQTRDFEKERISIIIENNSMPIFDILEIGNVNNIISIESKWIKLFTDKGIVLFNKKIGFIGIKYEEPKQRTYFTKKDMVDFGNYLLSEKRKQSFKIISAKNLKQRLSQVHDADLANFRDANP